MCVCKGVIFSLDFFWGYICQSDILNFSILYIFFRLQHNHYEFTTHMHNFKTKNRVRILPFKVSEIQIKIIIRFGTAKVKNTHLKTKNSPHTTQILILRYKFCRTQSNAKIYFFPLIIRIYFIILLYH